MSGSDIHYQKEPIAARDAGSNPAEPIVLFTIRYIRALNLGFLACEDA
jgi:hypothetical protein